MESDKVFNQKYFRPNRVILKMAFLWPYQNPRLKRFMNILLIILIFSLVAPQIASFIEQIKSEKINTEIIVETIVGLLFLQGVIAKYITCIKMQQKFKLLYVQISNDWNEIKEQTEREILRQQALFGRFLTLGTFAFVGFSCLSFPTIPYLGPIVLDILIPKNQSRPKMLCYSAEFYVDIEEYFIYFYLHSIAVAVIIFLIITSTDTTFVNSVLHVVGLFNIVRYRYKKLFEVVENEFVLTPKMEHKIYTYVLSCIEMHHNALEFYKVIQNCYRNVSFLIIINILTCLSMTGINVVLNLNNPWSLMRIAYFSLILIIYLFYTIWPGQVIIDASEKVFRSIYFSGWYYYPLKARFLIHFMMLRSSTPCKLTAGPLLDMNYECYGQVMKTAASFFTVMASIT